jgi:hypothetical protein
VQMHDCLLRWRGHLLRWPHRSWGAGKRHPFGADVCGRFERGRGAPSQGVSPACPGCPWTGGPGDRAQTIKCVSMLLRSVGCSQWPRPHNATARRPVRRRPNRRRRSNRGRGLMAGGKVHASSAGACGPPQNESNPQLGWFSVRAGNWESAVYYMVLLTTDGSVVP